MKRAMFVCVLMGCLAGSAGADLSDGLVAYYGFNGNADDLSGNGNHGTIYGGATFASDHWGNPNGALHFDGIDDYVLLSNESNFDLTTFSIVITARVPEYSQQNLFLCKGGWYGNYAITISNHPNTLGRPYYVHDNAGGGNHSVPISMTPVPVNEYVQLAVTYGVDGYWGCMSGSSCVKSSSVPAPLQTDYPVRMGASGMPSTSWFLHGDIDELRVYNRVLTASEVGELNAQINPVPVPGAVLLGILGLSVVGWKLRKFA